MKYGIYTYPHKVSRLRDEQTNNRLFSQARRMNQTVAQRVAETINTTGSCYRESATLNLVY